MWIPSHLCKLPNAALLGWVLAGWMLLHGIATAQSFVTGSYHWYAPEHEKYSQTIFYGEPRFNSRQVRIKTTQRFKVLGAQKGWFLLDFDIAGKAFIHYRLLHGLAYNPGASDPWYEFQRASVFQEDPARIEARLKPVSTDPQSSDKDSKTPSWKRYKDSWGLKPNRTTQLPSAGDASSETGSGLPPIATRPGDKKPKGKYSMLPPIGSEPRRGDGQTGTAPSDEPPAGDGTNVPMPNLP